MPEMPGASLGEEGTPRLSMEDGRRSHVPSGWLRELKNFFGMAQPAAARQHDRRKMR
jgi:hypothetical protein